MLRTLPTYKPTKFDRMPCGSAHYQQFAFHSHRSYAVIYPYRLGCTKSRGASWGLFPPLLMKTTVNRWRPLESHAARSIEAKASPGPSTSLRPCFLSRIIYGYLTWTIARSVPLILVTLWEWLRLYETTNAQQYYTSCSSRTPTLRVMGTAHPVDLVSS